VRNFKPLLLLANFCIIFSFNSFAQHVNFGVTEKISSHHTFEKNINERLCLNDFYVTNEEHNFFTAIKWSITNNDNYQVFEVQKADDALNFLTIATLYVNGNNYNYVYKNTEKDSKPTEYFRIKIIDKNGAISFSTILEWNRKVDLKIQVYPNPVTDFIFINLEKQIQHGSLSIFDMSGKILFLKAIKNTSVEKISTRLLKVTNQIVIIKITDGQNIITNKLMIR
jgi:Secretion system C-terminal sorting domain